LVAAHPARDVGGAYDLPDAVGDLRQDRIAGEVADPVIDLLEAVDVHDHEREPPLIPLGAVDLAAQRLVEVAAVVEACQGVEVGELPRLAEAARVLDRGRDALGELLEPPHVVGPEPDLGVARENAEPADPADAAEERYTECLVDRSGRMLLPVQVRKLDRLRVLALRCSGEDPDAVVVAFIAVQADRAEQALVSVAVGIELDDGRIDLREPGGGLECGADRVVEVDRRGDLAEEPTALRLLLGTADG